MKENTKKILLLLFSTDNSQVKVSYDNLWYMLPNLTVDGKKSLFQYLIKKQLINVSYIYQNHQRVKAVELSSYGKKMILDRIPALARLQQNQPIKWQMIVFLKAPVSDQNFRHLKELLIRIKAIQIQRAVYIYPGKIKPDITSLINHSYYSSVLVIDIANWVLNNLNDIIGYKTLLLDTIYAYSEISNQLYRLLNIEKKINCFDIQQKKAINSLFDRFLNILNDDFGLVNINLSQENEAFKLLRQFQSIINI